MSELLKINVNDHVEKKNGLSYLSWAWAWTKVIEIDPTATWEAFEFNGFPAAFNPDGSAMVKTAVTIKGHTKTCWLPVMNYKNQAIKNPDSFQVNTAIVRCLTKTISMHGLGLYIYAGEDLPEDDDSDAKSTKSNVTVVRKRPANYDPKAHIPANKGFEDVLSQEAKEICLEWAEEATDICRNVGASDAIDFLASKNIQDQDERHYIFDILLPKDVREQFSKISKQQKAA